MQGQQNSNLNAIGRDQAESHGLLLATLGIDALYASPLERARETADIICRHIALPIRFDDRIKEWDCGAWSGHLRADVRTRWPDEWAALEADPFHYRGPGCENYPDMIERSRPFVDEILAAGAARIAVVSHGLIGRVMVGVLMGFDVRRQLEFRQPNDVIYRVRLRGGGQGAGPGAQLDHYRAGRGPLRGVVSRD
jgi:broad specificity phosphatase PhoE